MAAIEPNWMPLIWFTAFATICMIALLVVAGMFPLRSRPEAARSGAAPLLAIANGALLAVLLAATALYGYAELRWSSLVVVTGLVVLFSPGLFELCPSALRDGSTGLVLLIGLQAVALAALAKVATLPWGNMS